MPEVSGKFTLSQRVFAGHRCTALYYDAKVIQIKVNADGKPEYLVHYQGWNKNWDEWLPEEWLLEHTPDNEEVSKRSIEEAQKRALELKRLKPGRKRDDVRPKKRRTDGSSDGGDQAEQFDLTYQIPKSLKAFLVEEWEKLFKDQKLLPVPRSPTVADILEAYRAHKIAQIEAAPAPGSGEGASGDAADGGAAAGTAAAGGAGSSAGNSPAPSAGDGGGARGGDGPGARKGAAEAVGELVSGLKEYFDKALGVMLLYRFERPQFQALADKHPETPASELYGAEHLLRLFGAPGSNLCPSNPTPARLTTDGACAVKLPTLVDVSTLDDASLRSLSDHLDDLLAFLAARQSEYFSGTFVDPDEAYMERWKLMC
eukprot:tig00000076_g2303.t1